MNQNTPHKPARYREKGHMYSVEQTDDTRWTVVVDGVEVSVLRNDAGQWLLFSQGSIGTVEPEQAAALFLLAKDGHV